MPEDFLRRESSRRNSGRTLAVLVFVAASLLSVAALAKYSYALPRSNSSHWICKACKILDHRHAASAGATVIRTVAIILDRTPRIVPVETRIEGDQARAPSPEFLKQSPLRAPPSA